MVTTQRRSKEHLRKTSWSEFIKLFNAKHNKKLNTSVGVVNVKTKNNY